MLKAASRTTSYLFCAFALAACGGGGGGDDGGGFNTPPSFQVGGSVSGLTGSGLVLQNNGGNNLSITANGTFTFSQSVQSGASYNVTVATQPTNPAQTCTVTNGSGSVSGAAVTNVSVACTGQVGKFLYVPNFGSNSVSAFSISANTGMLSAVTGSPFAADQRPLFAAADRNTKWLFVSNLGSASAAPTISGYSINATTGVLTALTDSPFDLSTTSPPPVNQPLMGRALIHPSGGFGYVNLPLSPQSSGPPKGQVYGATINTTTGDLTEIPGLPVEVGTGVGVGVFNSAGTVLYLPHDDLGVTPTGTVALYSVSVPSGALSPIGTIATGGQGAGFAALSADGKFYFVPNRLSNTLAVFAVNATNGALTAAPGSPYNTDAANRTGAAVVHPSKNFVYITNNNDAAAGVISTIAGFQFDGTTGALTKMPGSPFSTGGIKGNLAAIDPTGKFLYVANGDSDNVQGFAIDQTSGVLTPVPGSPFAAGDFPLAVAIDPSGRYLYVPNTNSANVSSFAINATSGVLTPVNTIAAGTSPSVVEIVGLQ